MSIKQFSRAGVYWDLFWLVIGVCLICIAELAFHKILRDGTSQFITDLRHYYLSENSISGKKGWVGIVANMAPCFGVATLFGIFGYRLSFTRVLGLWLTSVCCIFFCELCLLSNASRNE